MADAPLLLAVVGHTNVGKTSLLRTLTRDAGFGEVSPQHGTTRHVEGAQLSVDGRPLLALYDTPGLEDAVALRDHLDAAVAPGERLDGPQRVLRFLSGPEARARFEQEAKVLRQLLASDAGLLVIDVREPVLAKYRDEFEILSWCGKPLLPVLNFVLGGDAREEDWRRALAHAGLHAMVRFDSVAPPLDGEQRLYESLALLLEAARPALSRLVQDLQAQRAQRRFAAALLVADLLVDVASCRRQVAPEEDAVAQAVQQLRADVRAREQRCVDDLLRLYAFRPEDAQAGDMPLLDGRWESDLFNPETLRRFGLRVGGGMAAGAAAGVGIDLMVGGLTLGAAAALGALVGGTWQTVRRYGQRLQGRLQGRRELGVDDAIVRLLALRQQHLLAALEARGHAATQAITLDAGGRDDARWRSGQLPEALQLARAWPEWSSLSDGATRVSGEAPQRQAQVEALARQWLDERPPGENSPAGQAR